MANQSNSTSPNFPEAYHRENSSQAVSHLVSGRLLAFRYQTAVPAAPIKHAHAEVKLAVLFHPAAGVITHWDDKATARELFLTGRQVFCFGSNAPYIVRWERESSWIEVRLHDELVESMPPEQVAAVLARTSLDGASHDHALWEMASKIRILCSQPEQPNLRLLEPMMLALVRRVLTCHGECYAPKRDCYLSEDRTQTVVDFMEENVAKRVDAATLAGLVKLSVQHFTELFHNRTGRPPIEYLRELRRIKAHDMIFSGEMRMGEIADACGFCDEPHLNREFKKFFGYSAKLLRTRGRSALDSGIPVARS